MKITPETLFKDIHSWHDFEMRLQDFSKKEKGDAFELLTKFYFKLDPVLSSKYQEIWAFAELPKKEVAFLDLPR